MSKYPCRNCVYFKECGSNTRTEKCVGRQTKSQKKTVDHTLKIKEENYYGN